MTYEELTGQHNFNCEHAGYPSFFNDINEDVLDMSLDTMTSNMTFMDPNIPIMDTKVYAVKA